MARWQNYHWLPQTDQTIYNKEMYRSEVVDATLSKCGKYIVMDTYVFFPVGSIFHTLHGCVDYVIKKKDRTTYKNRVYVSRCDGSPVSLDDVLELKRKRIIYRDGFEYINKV